MHPNQCTAEALESMQSIEASIIGVECQPSELIHSPSSTAAAGRPCVSSSFSEIGLQGSCTEPSAVPDSPQRALKHAATVQWLQHADDGTEPAPTGIKAAFSALVGKLAFGVKAKCTAPAVVLAAAPTRIPSPHHASSWNDAQYQTEAAPGSSVLGVHPCARQGRFTAPLSQMPVLQGSSSKGSFVARGSKGGIMLLSCLFGSSAADDLQREPESAAQQIFCGCSPTAAEDNDNSAQFGQDPCACRPASKEPLNLPIGAATSWLWWHRIGTSRKTGAAGRSANHSLRVQSSSLLTAAAAGRQHSVPALPSTLRSACSPATCTRECSCIAVGSRGCSADMHASSRTGSSTAREASTGRSSLPCQSLSETGSKWAAQHAIHGQNPAYGMQSRRSCDCSLASAGSSCSLGTGFSSRARSGTGSGNHCGGSSTSGAATEMTGCDRVQDRETGVM
jgi:hypothetical protein